MLLAARPARRSGFPRRPLQHNFNFGVGPEEDLQYVLNIQPVIPVNLTKGWALIS